MNLPRYEPMLAVRWKDPFSDPGWSFEVKWDGVRVLLYWDGDRVELRSRRGRDVTATYPELGGFRAPRPCVLDGEVVAFDESGRPSFELLQGRMNLTGEARIAEVSRRTPVTYMVFDLLHDGDEEVIERPLIERREILDDHALPAPCLRSLSVIGEGEAFFEASAARGLEGVVGKRLASPYRPGARSADWRKVAALRTVRTVVGGYTSGEGGRSSTFAALLVGMWDGPRLRWCGSVGTGFDDRTLELIRATLDELETGDPPFRDDPALPGDAIWVRPGLVAMVEFKEWTAAGRMRAPSFKGFTDDPLEAVTWEEEGPGGAAPGS